MFYHGLINNGTHYFDNTPKKQGVLAFFFRN